MLTVPDLPEKVTGRSGTFTDMSAEVTNSTACIPAQSVYFRSKYIRFVVTYSLESYFGDRPHA